MVEGDNQLLHILTYVTHRHTINKCSFKKKLQKKSPVNTKHQIYSVLSSVCVGNL